MHIKRTSLVESFSESEQKADDRVSMSESYDTIPEEYLETVSIQYPRLPSISEEDPSLSNYQMERQADHLLKVLANPGLFTGGGERKRRHSQTKVNRLAEGIFRITGSVAIATTVPQSDESSSQKAKISETEFSSKGEVTRTRNSVAVSEEIIRSVKRTKKISPLNLPPYIEKKNKTLQFRRNASFAEFSSNHLPDIKED